MIPVFWPAPVFPPVMVGSASYFASWGGSVSRPFKDRKLGSATGLKSSAELKVIDRRRGAYGES